MDKTEYQAGDEVKGEVVFECDKSFKCNAIHLTFTGREHTRIVVSTGKTSHAHTDELVFFTSTIDFDASGEIASGVYRYPFQFVIPEDGPTSYDGICGWIEYRLKALVEITRALDVKDEVFLDVRGSRKSVVSESRREYAEKNGYSVLDVELIKSSIYIGEDIDLRFRVSNTVKIRGVRIELRSVEQTKAGSLTRKSDRKLAEYFVEKDQVRRDLWTEFRIQTYDTMPPNYDGELLDIEIILKITLDIPWSFDRDVKIPVTLSHRGSEAENMESSDDWFK